jgi:transcriptional regulator with GAF, ATPase, and Fis domain
MEGTLATRVAQRPDGTQALILHRARLTVVKGPDQGLILLIDRPEVQIGTGAHCDFRLTDPAVSRQHLELRATELGFVIQDAGSTNGTYIGGVRLREAVIDAPAMLRVGETLIQISPSIETMEIPLSAQTSFGGLLGSSQKMRQVFAVLERVAPTKSTVLLEGESGTGKDVAAQSIHELSPRRDGSFVIVDCGAIPPTLMESELFGHEKGAFTGAHDTRRGALEEADGGTLFLDEIGELPTELQPRLLRFIERQEVKRVGGSQHREVDVRIIAATNRRLSVEVQEGRFRQDLFYRLSVVQVEIPPLRDRPEDVVPLACLFAEKYHKDPRAIITDATASLLTAYRWPGNVRELRNVVERLALVPELAMESLESGGRGAAVSTGSSGPVIGPLASLPFHEARRRWQDLFERQYLAAQMAAAGNVVTKAANRADLPRQTFHRLLRRHGLREG